MYGYLDKYDGRYFDGISPCISDNRDEEGYFKDKNYTLKNEIITKYIDRKYESIKTKFNIRDENEYKENLRKRYKFKRLSKIIKENKSTKSFQNLGNDKTTYFKPFLQEEETFKINQGNLGDCYLISFLNGMIKFRKEEFIRLLGGCLFELGYIEFNFFFEENNNFKQKIVFVDDYILVDEYDNNSPIFSSVFEI